MALLSVSTQASAQRASVLRADSSYAIGERERAEREYAEVLAVDPNQSHAAFRLAQLREKRDISAAIALYRRYVQLQPRDAWGYIALGDALGRAGDVSAASRAYDDALRLAPNERDVHVGRARMLARAMHTDASIEAYEQYLVRTPRDVDAWRELAAQRRRAGQYGEAISDLERARSLDTAQAGVITKDIGRVRALARATVEPLAGGSTDSDGLTTERAGATVTSPLLGRARVFASGSADRAGDGSVSRGAQMGAIGLLYRPLAQLRFELAGGVARADRSFIDSTTTFIPRPNGPNGRPRPPIGVTTVRGVSNVESFPVGRARLSWRNPGDAVAVDVRGGRQLLDASPYLIAQGVLRDEASLSLDVRLAGPVRARGFARLASIHNADESNGRKVLGGALAYVPGPWEVTLRAQSMTYDAASTLAYFAPRYVRTAEATSYIETETEGGTTFAIDLGAGGQQVADWTTAAGEWSPSFHAWAQMLMPLTPGLSLGSEVEAYSSRVSTDAPGLSLSADQWRYGSLSVWLRVAF
ncbi:MAG: tetratricopeptide repeat protein [Gemmatimonadaceae bacterium]